MTKEKFTFQAEVGKLLDIVARSLYSQKEIFLRELASNASDACDKLRYAALTDPALIDGDGDFKIEIKVDKKAKTLSVIDNGIGMSRDELAETLGTIAKSGTEAFLEQASGDDDNTVDLIGQFGVGFYSSFMVASQVDVVSRKAGEDKAFMWSSDGHGEFTIEDAERDGRGTTVTLHLNKDDKEYLDETRLEHVIKSHSDHIGIPIVMAGEDGEKTLNSASALWTLPKKDITDEQYKEFYNHVGHAFDEPWLTMHNAIEGVISYTNLLFIPSAPPFDLFTPERKGHVKLYVNRVFITDDCEGLLPPYLRFLRGIVDSQDLPLNISREMFQHDPRLAKIKTGLTKRVLSELKKKAEKKPEEYAPFWDNFGAVLKEGLYEDQTNREKLIELVRFESTKDEGLRSLADVVADKKEGQDAIYYITGENPEQVRQSPQLEGFKSRGIEVLLMCDPIDEFWLPGVGSYQDIPFKSVTRGDVDLDNVADDGDAKDKTDKPKNKDRADMDDLIVACKVALGDAVKDVQVSDRLTDSPVCLISGDGDMDIHLERMLRQHKQLDAGSARILEINPDHPLIAKLAVAASDGKGTDDIMTDAAFLLLDQARILEGEAVSDPAAFAKRMSTVMERGLV
ncbi:MAG: molecular chaperone HtpG [Rhodospirillaceae bacterium]|jgi:molecular chaperone HtpG|nr:molecular chaperone HtpG [Rhodospirillaceae bacterium]MBT4465007.1 molecular chaperone HtpG [Rhodospirillaceae bacterium]MBT5014459.1 molecular chaperone HtpG [Rhodospirillaceae bacterium]MBT6406389.1 molecular chaperone HtpG [Rhodospirillaceae bacterium]MBT7355304.1 molecular chaperone HtpG [Rhodospirillaceae bacterium]